MSHSTFGVKDSSWTNLLAIETPLANAFNVPPSPWIVITSTGFPVFLISLYTSKGSVPSHPSPTTTTAPTFGWIPVFTTVFNVSLASAPNWQHPKVLLIWVAPSTALAISAANLFEQTLVANINT